MPSTKKTRNSRVSVTGSTCGGAADASSPMTAARSTDAAASARVSSAPPGPSCASGRDSTSFVMVELLPGQIVGELGLGRAELDPGTGLALQQAVEALR